MDRRRFLATGIAAGAFAASRCSAAEPASQRLFTLSQHGCGRATAYAEANKIVTIGNRTHVTWLDSQDGQFFVRVRTLDRETGTWSPVYTVGGAYDNHGGPALAADHRGHLHIVYFPHHHPFRYRRSVKPNDASEWTSETVFGKRHTYPSMVILPDDTLVLVCRERTDSRYLLTQYTKTADDRWEAPRTILHGHAPSGYTRWQAALALGNEGATIHMSFMIYESSNGPGYAIGYLRTRDGGRSWERSDGTPVQLPATPDTIEIVHGASKSTGPRNLRPGNIAVDSQDTPWLIYSRLDRQPFETWIAHPGAHGRWETTSLLPMIRQQWPNRSVKTPGQIVFDQHGAMYVSATTVRDNASAGKGYWGHESAEVVLATSRDGGQTFRVAPVSPPVDQIPNWLPSLERPTRHVSIGAPSLIYTHGHRGSDSSQIMANDVVWCDLNDATSDR